MGYFCYKLDSLKVESLNNFRVLNIGIYGTYPSYAYITNSFKIYDVTFNIVLISANKNYFDRITTIQAIFSIAVYNYQYSVTETFNINGIELYFVSDNPNTPTMGKGRLAIKIPDSYQRITLLTHMTQGYNYSYTSPILDKPFFVENLPQHKHLLVK